MNMFEKLTQMFNDGKIDKVTYKAKLQELRQHKYQLDIKQNLTKKEEVFINNSIIEDGINDDGLFTLLYNILLDNHMINDGLHKDIILNVNYFVKNDYIVGLFNLLADKTYFYNKIGLKYVISNYLYDLNDLNDLKVFEVNNDILADNFKFLVYKNNKIKHFTKLYFNNEYQIIIMNTLLHDGIKSIVLFDKTKYTDEDIFSIIQDKTNLTNEANIKHINFKKYQYRFKDKEVSLFNKTKYLYYLLDKILSEGNYNYIVNYNKIRVTDKNLKTYLKTFKDNFSIIYSNDKLLSIYEDIQTILNDIEEFKSNDIEKISLKEEEANDYFKYDIDLKDYFINP